MPNPPINLAQDLQTEYVTTNPERSDPLRKVKAGKYEIKSVSYPANDENNHFVRFYPRVDDESRLIRDNKVIVTGDLDQTDQNRAARKNTSQARFDTAAGVMGGIGGYTIGSQLVSGANNPNSMLSKLAGLNGGGKSTQFAKSVKNMVTSPDPKASLRKGTIAKAVGAVGGATVGVAVANSLNVTKKLKKISACITLYTPMQVISNLDMNWDLRESQIADVFAADRGQELFGHLMSQNKDGYSSYGMAARILATNASNDLQLMQRTTKNPKKDFLFRDMVNRNFQFNYNFAPTNAQEAMEVAEIIYMFRLFSTPELLSGFDNFLYIYPAEWDIVYGFKDPSRPEANPENNPFLNRISSCVLSSIHINYSPGGSFHSLKGGEPAMVNMELSFQELESLHQGRIEQGF